MCQRNDIGLLQHMKVIGDIINGDSSYRRMLPLAILFYRHGKVKWSLHVIFGLSLAVFIGVIFIPGKGQEKIISNVFLLTLSALIGFTWVVVVFYNKSYLKVTNDSLEYKAVFGKPKVINLDSIYEIKFFSIQGSRLLGIRSKAEIRGRRPIWQAIDRFFGYGYSISISVSAFSDVDFNKLAVTIASRVPQEPETLREESQSD